MIVDVTDLRIYQISLKLLRPLSELMKNIPDRELRFQTMDAVKSIAPMIAEGYSKRNLLKNSRDFWKWRWVQVMK